MVNVLLDGDVGVEVDVIVHVVSAMDWQKYCHQQQQQQRQQLRQQQSNSNSSRAAATATATATAASWI